MKPLRVVGVNFAHMHMGDNLRMAAAHPDCEVVGICDESPATMQDAVADLKLPAERIFTDYRQCLESTRPDLAILCPPTAEHALWTERVAEYDVAVMIEKPFAASLADADRMIAAVEGRGQLLAVNWPLTWSPPHRTAKRLIDEGRIGTLLQVHYYGGNRGPLWHTAHKHERTAEQVAAEKPTSWFYQRAHGGGSMLDYLGYGATLGTWLMDGRRPLDVTAMVDRPAGLEVDEQSVTIARYETGLSKFETRWGTFTDPWTHQTQPRCGFILVGEAGTIASADYAESIQLQTAEHPAGVAVPCDKLAPPYQNPVQNVVACLREGAALAGPLTPAISRIGQEIIDAAVQSAQSGRTVSLPAG
ncbi:MAG: glucose-fructose oxidoreductase [Planctomycetaceae bacterium]|nr:glucose-fructose oxidoreductase [Planctomycetaceae bacterium]